MIAMGDYLRCILPSFETFNYSTLVIYSFVKIVVFNYTNSLNMIKKRLIKEFSYKHKRFNEINFY